jgi:hypothetical protein
MSGPDATSGFPTYTGPSSQFPTGGLSPLYARGAGETQGETPGAIASSLKAELTATGFTEASRGVGVHADHHA